MEDEQQFSKSVLRRPMKLVDRYTGRMECRVCGSEHWGMLKHGGGFCRGAWQCSNQFCPTKDR